MFLTGHQEIELACSKLLDMLPSEELDRIVVFPLYAALDITSQRRVFEPAPPGCRKVVFSTNIAVCNENKMKIVIYATILITLFT